MIVKLIIRFGPYRIGFGSFGLGPTLGNFLRLPSEKDYKALVRLARTY